MQAGFRKFLKGMRLLEHPSLVNVALRHRVVAAVEHFAAIRICQANTLLDVGANKGQFSLAFRTLCPRAQIIAYEPLPEAADVYAHIFPPDSLNRLERVALSSSDGSAMFYVTDRADSSSLLRPGVGQERAFRVRRASTIEVPVTRLDASCDLAGLPHPILLKVDVQGGELGVFEGCERLAEIDFIYVELSFTELYEGQPLFQDMIDYLADRGFTVAGIFNQVMTAEFGPTQVDVLLKRVSSLERRDPTPNRPGAA